MAMSGDALFVASMFVTLAAVPAAAQPGGCAARAQKIAVTAAFTAGTGGTGVDEALAGAGFGEEAFTNASIGVRGEGIVPLASSWGVAVGALSYRQGVWREDRAGSRPFPVVGTTDAGSIHVLHYSIGAVNQFGRGRRFCPYAGLAAGLYRFDYRGSRRTAAGGTGKFGFELPTSDAAGFVVEFQFDWIVNNSDSPLEAERIPIAWITIGFRSRF